MPGKLAVDQRAAAQQRDQRNRWRSLCNSARRGDGAAFGEICERLRPHLLRIADRNLGKDLRSKVAAADIVQASILEALGGFDHFVGDSEADFRAWVERILVNNLIDLARHYRCSQKRCTGREIPIDSSVHRTKLVSSVGTASSIVRHQETDEELVCFVALLPERRRQVVDMHFRKGMTHAEIAGRLQITEVAARKILSRAVEQLRSMLAGQEHVLRPNQPR